MILRKMIVLAVALFLVAAPAVCCAEDIEYKDFKYSDCDSWHKDWVDFAFAFKIGEKQVDEQNLQAGEAAVRNHYGMVIKTKVPMNHMPESIYWGENSQPFTELNCFTSEETRR